MPNTSVRTMSFVASLCALTACGGIDTSSTESTQSLTSSNITPIGGFGELLPPLSSPPGVVPSPLCLEDACDQYCSDAGATVGTPSYGLCQAGGCACLPFIFPPGGGGGGPGGGRGCLRTGCPHGQSCDLNGVCIPDPFTCDNPEYALDHVCECVPELHCS
jgi:hypothetical protein